MRVLLLISPPGTSLSPPLWVTWKRSHAIEKSSSCDLEKWALSRHKRNYFYPGLSLTVPLSCTSTTGGWTTWGYKGSSLIHTFCKKPLKHLLLPLVRQKQPGLALLQLTWVCSSIFPSSVTASILSSSFSSLYHFHFLSFFSNVIFLFSTILCFPSSKLLPSFTASNFTWLGGKEESNKFTVTNSLALRAEQQCSLVLLPTPFLLGAAFILWKYEIIDLMWKQEG